MKRFHLTREEYERVVYLSLATTRPETMADLRVGNRLMEKLEGLGSVVPQSQAELEAGVPQRVVLRADQVDVLLENDESDLLVKWLEAAIVRLPMQLARLLPPVVDRVREAKPVAAELVSEAAAVNSNREGAPS